MAWEVPKIWEGGDVWILGGGPSVTKQFNIPEKVVQNVITGTSPLSAYSPYMKAIHDKHVIGINVAYLIGDWIDMVFFGDSGFFLSHAAGLAAFPGLKVSCHSGVSKYHWVKFTPRDRRHNLGISSVRSMVSWNGNSGSAAISLAVHTGAKRIFLLGFDMKMSGEKQHWHDVYKRIGNQSKKRMIKLPFHRHLVGFAQIAKDAGKMGVEIINVCPDSMIPQFRKVNLKDCL